MSGSSAAGHLSKYRQALAVLDTQPLSIKVAWKACAAALPRARTLGARAARNWSIRRKFLLIWLRLSHMLWVKPWVGEGEGAAAAGREFINLEALSCLRNTFLKKQGISKLDRIRGQDARLQQRRAGCAGLTRTHGHRGAGRGPLCAPAARPRTAAQRCPCSPPEGDRPGQEKTNPSLSQKYLLSSQGRSQPPDTRAAPSIGDAEAAAG